MKILLAGYNIDTQVLKEYENIAGKRADATPETLSASYARISRDPRPIDELRDDARIEIEKSRKSNRAIIFKMGHHSVAEHAVFNFDIIGVSRFAIEQLEKLRLCSFTEKSQRYITLENDFVIPQEIQETGFDKEYTDMVKEQNRLYHDMNDRLTEHVFSKHSELAKDPKKRTLLEGWAKEDARYITSLATEGQLGMTINARNLELMFRRFASHPLNEVRTIGKNIYTLVKNVAPSIILFTDANDYDAKTLSSLEEYFKNRKMQSSDVAPSAEVLLHHYTNNADDQLVASIMHHATSKSFSACRDEVDKMTPQEKTDIIKKTFQYMEFYDSTLREFEFLNLVYELTISSSCFAQLKRHRMSTPVTQDYDPLLGLTIPDSIKEIGFEKRFLDVTDKTEELYRRIKKVSSTASPYILTNAHRRRVLFGVNARELYHITRLREDAHAQWDIQNISKKMRIEAEKVMPLTMMFIGSKEVYPIKFKEIFGKEPKFTEIPG
ncbi:MAG: FAD-dependent thymidylate synthase [Candidatus Aureabacteria bacterium]|nr:FAD-dependent thymidylate synthase [Candidatus Auribacterota bacterium]